MEIFFSSIAWIFSIYNGLSIHPKSRVCKLLQQVKAANNRSSLDTLRIIWPTTYRCEEGLHPPHKEERAAEMTCSFWGQQGPSLWRESEMCTSGKKGARSKACWLQYGGASGERRVPGKHQWVRTRKSKGDTCFRNQVLRSSQEIFYCRRIQASPHPHRCLWYMCPHSWMLYMQIHYSLNSIYVNPTTH